MWFGHGEIKSMHGSGGGSVKRELITLKMETLCQR